MYDWPIRNWGLRTLSPLSVTWKLSLGVAVTSGLCWKTLLTAMLPSSVLAGTPDGFAVALIIYRQ